MHRIVKDHVTLIERKLQMKNNPAGKGKRKGRKSSLEIIPIELGEGSRDRSLSTADYPADNLKISIPGNRARSLSAAEKSTGNIKTIHSGKRTCEMAMDKDEDGNVIDTFDSEERPAKALTLDTDSLQTMIGNAIGPAIDKFIAPKLENALGPAINKLIVPKIDTITTFQSEIKNEIKSLGTKQDKIKDELETQIRNLDTRLSNSLSAGEKRMEDMMN